MFKENRIIGILGGGQLGKMVLDVANKWGLKVYVLDSSEKCPSSKLCSRFFQGDLMDFDTVINFGKKVFKSAPEPKKAIFVSDAGHNNLYEFKIFDKIKHFLK